jgi:hypothetical protein
MYQPHGRWFRLSVEQFDMLHYAGMSIFKIGIILLNLVPYIALHKTKRRSYGFQFPLEQAIAQIVDI